MIDLDEKKLAAMTPEQIKEVGKMILQKKKKKVFVPNPGPQTDAYFSEADVLLFGGSPGGGKSALEIGLALNEHYRSLIVREHFSDTEGLIDTAKKLAKTKDGFVGGTRPKYNKPDGGVIHFAGLAEDGGIGGHQGVDHDLICVERGTKVCMVDGSLKAIETLEIGDMVLTLEGGRRVKTLIPLRRDKGVRVKAYNDKGEVIASQVQSQTHALLTLYDWDSYKASSQCPKSLVSKLNHAFCKLFAPISGLYQEFLQLRANPFLGLLNKVLQVLRFSGLLCLWGIYAFCALFLRGTYFLRYCGQHQEKKPPVLLFSQQEHHGLPAPSWLRLLSAKISLLRDETYALILSLLPGSQESCSVYSHPYGGQPHKDGDFYSALKDDQLYLHQLNDVEQPNPNDFVICGRGKTQKYTQFGQLYVHPYTKDIRQIQGRGVFVSYSYEPVGIVDLFDIEVEEVNNYITEGGFVNKNCVDEAANIPESQIRLLLGWLRSDKPGQRCRMVLGSNPPLDSTGDWLIKFFAPWLDPQHPNPAEAGELRYFIPDEEGNDRECNKGDFMFIHGVKVFAQSRTFIPSKFTDNPFYNAEEYAKSLSALPKEAREILISGNFLLNRPDSLWQLIPKDWVKAAVKRWNTHRPQNIPMSAVGVDCAQGGADSTVLARRYDGWYDTLIEVPGKDTPEGKDIAALVVKNRRDGATVIVDMGGGYGGATKEQLESNGIKVVGYKGTKGTSAVVKGSRIGFPNVRSEAYWAFRDALDPSQPGGSKIALPDNQRLISELCTPEYRYQNNKYKVESKEEVVSRLGRSTDYADAVIMAWYAGEKNVTSFHPGQQVRDLNKPVPKVVLGHQNQRRPRR